MPTRYTITTEGEAPVSLTFLGRTGGYVDIQAKRLGVAGVVIASFNPDGELELATGIATELADLGLADAGTGKLAVVDAP